MTNRREVMVAVGLVLAMLAAGCSPEPPTESTPEPPTERLTSATTTAPIVDAAPARKTLQQRLSEVLDQEPDAPEILEFEGLREREQRWRDDQRKGLFYAPDHRKLRPLALRVASQLDDEHVYEWVECSITLAALTEYKAFREIVGKDGALTKRMLIVETAYLCSRDEAQKLRALLVWDMLETRDHAIGIEYFIEGLHKSERVPKRRTIAPLKQQ